MKTSIFFGGDDWMYFGDKNPDLGDLNPLIKQRVFEGVSHNIQFDQPKLLTSFMLSDLDEYLNGSAQI